jgi:hypothetical protein
MTLCVFECTDAFGLPPLNYPSGFKDSAVPEELVVFQLDSDGGFSIPPLLEVLPDASCGLVNCRELASFSVLPFDIINDTPLGQSLSTGNNPAIRFPKLAHCITPENPSPTREWFGHGIEGVVDVPRVTTSSSASGNRVRATGTDKFVDVALDVDQWFANILETVTCNTNITALFGETLPINDVSNVINKFPGADETNFEASYDLLAISLPITVSERQAYTFEPSFDLLATFPQEVDYRVPNPSGGWTEGRGRSVAFALGATIQVRFPQGRKTPMGGASRYTVVDADNFTNAQHIDFDVKLTEKVVDLDFAVKFPEVTIASGITVDPCLLDPLGWFGPDSCPKEIGDIAFPGVDIGAYLPEHPEHAEEGLYNWEQPLANPSLEKFNDTWSLGGFQSKNGRGFVLDPENPSIAVSADPLKSGLATGTGPPGSLVQEFVVTNTGDVQLIMTQVQDALSKRFGVPGFSATAAPACPSGRLDGVVCILSISDAQLAPNGAFDGLETGGDAYTLLGTDTDTLDADPDEAGPATGGTARLRVAFFAEAGNIYDSKVDAWGQSRLNTKVTSSADLRSHAVFALNIDMDVFNGPGSPRAQIPVHFMSTEALDVADIDPESIQLDGLSPVHWDVEPREDIGPETDLVLQFMRQQVWEIVQARLSAPAATAAVFGPKQLSAVVAALLSDLGDADAESYADGIGNQNGLLDVGDLRSVIEARERAAGQVETKARATETLITLPFTGEMTDGTPLVGEDSFIVRGD